MIGCKIPDTMSTEAGSTASEIDDESDSGDDREVIAFVLVLDELEV